VRRIAIFIDSDSQYFGTKSIANFFLNAGWQVDYVVPTLDKFPNVLVEELQENYSVVLGEIDEFCFSEEFFSYAAVGCYSHGSKIRRFQRNVSFLHQKFGHRPYIFSGYNGVVYEKYEEGIYWRCGYDSICVNGQRDVDLFTSILAGTEARNQKIIPLGLNKPKQESSKNIKRKTVVFAEQVIVPARVETRKRLFETLSDFASANKEWEVIVKPRVPVGGTTFHNEILHPEKYNGWPENVRISHEPLQDLMQEAQALLSVSSTAFFDAVAFDITPLCIMDFGVNSRHGNHFFVGCGTEFLLRDCAPIETLLEMKVSPLWLLRTGYNLNGYNQLKQDIEAWSVGPLPPAFPEGILTTTRKGRTAARETTEDAMLFERAKTLKAKGDFAALAMLIESEHDWFVSNPHAAYLAIECYEELGQLRTAFRWLRLVRKSKPGWKKVNRKALAIGWKWISGLKASKVKKH